MREGGREGIERVREEGTCSDSVRDGCVDPCVSISRTDSQHMASLETHYMTLIYHPWHDTFQVVDITCHEENSKLERKRASWKASKLEGKEESKLESKLEGKEESKLEERKKAS